MHNSILIAILLMLVPGMVSAQFYTITKEAKIDPIQANDIEKTIDNKTDTGVSKSIERTKDATVSLLTDSASLNQYTQKWTVRRPKQSGGLSQTGIFLNWQYLIFILKSNGTASYIRKWYWHKPFWKQVGSPLRCVGIGTTSSGWPIHVQESIMSLTIGRKVSVLIIPRCSTSTNVRMVIICFGSKGLDMQKLPIMFRRLSVC